MKKITTLLSFLLIIQFSQAQVNEELKTWIQQSFSYFPKLKELDKTTELGEIRINIAESNYLPNINGTASYNYVNPVSEKNFGAPGAEEVLKFQPFNNYNFNVGLNQVIWDFGKTQAQIEKAKTELLVTRQNTEVAKIQLATQVTSIYYSIIYLNKSIELQDTVIGFYNANKKIIEGRIKQGDGLLIDLSNIETNISQEKNRRLEFQRQLDRQLALLTYTTGQTTSPTATELNLQIAISDAPNTLNNPELLAADQKISSAQSDQKLAQQNRLPSLNFQAGAGYKNGYQPDIEKIRFNYLAGVTLQVPIFQGHRIQQNVVLSRKTVELNELSKNNLTISLQKDLESVKADLIAYHEQILNSQTQIDAAREALRLTQVRYNRGVSTYLDLIFASTNMQRGLLNQWQYEYQECLAKAELARLEGRKFWEE